MRLIIKGAYYFDGDSILQAHYTGEFHTVDCTQYVKEKELKEKYPDSFIAENKDNYIEKDGIKYCYAEYSPFAVTDEWELLSDLSELEHIEKDFDF